MMATDVNDLSRKAMLRALLAGQGEIKLQLTQLREDLLMGLNKNEQDIVDRIDASTTKVAGIIQKGADAQTAATQSIRDLFQNQSSITLADVAPKLDAMDAAADSFGSAADALKALATQDDPAINPDAPPVTVTQPDGTTAPVSETPVG